jgi:hypothetical protein
MVEMILLAVLYSQNPRQEVKQNIPRGIEIVTFVAKKDMKLTSRLRGQIFVWSVRAGLNSDSLKSLTSGVCYEGAVWTGASRTEFYSWLDIGIHITRIRSH